MNELKLTKFFSCLIFLTTSLLLSTTLPVKGETVLEEINRTGVLKVGIRKIRRYLLCFGSSD